MKKASLSKPVVWAEIDLAALRQNLKVIRAALHSPAVKTLAIVKADAYGHGMPMVARTLSRAGVDFFGVATIDEAVQLRRICPRAQILVLGSFHPDQIGTYAAQRIIPTISSVEDVAEIERAKLKSPLSAHLKIDTGMGRLGVWHEEIHSLLKALTKAKRLRVEGIYTHFSRADHEDQEFTREQLHRFDEAAKEAAAAGIRPRYLHAANSMGLVRFKEAHLNLVRPGIVLYGLNPSSTAPLPKGLRPVMSLKAKISFLKKVEKGRTISYGATYETPRATQIATLPIGYSHGYKLGFSNKAHVVVRGKKCPVIGRVTMDQTLVDVGGVPSVRRWDEVTLIGHDGRAGVSAEDLAKLIGTIPYEIVCSVHSRIPRIYKNIR